MSGSSPAAEVEAAGGVVVRDEGDRRLVAIVHRPRWDDWTFPKGHLERGEELLDCALREVLEETGLVCEADAVSIEAHHVDHKGRAKRVTYWRMRPLSGVFTPNREVDEIGWFTRGQARRRLTYAGDQRVLDSLVAREKISRVVHLPFSK